jgi:hypothetical protein
VAAGRTRRRQKRQGDGRAGRGNALLASARRGCILAWRTRAEADTDTDTDTDGGPSQAPKPSGCSRQAGGGLMRCEREEGAGRAGGILSCHTTPHHRCSGPVRPRRKCGVGQRRPRHHPMPSYARPRPAGRRGGPPPSTARQAFH